MVVNPVAAAEDVDPALLLTVASVLLRMRVLQFGLKQDHAAALEVLPVFRFWNLLCSRDAKLMPGRQGRQIDWFDPGLAAQSLHATRGSWLT